MAQKSGQISKVDFGHCYSAPQNSKKFCPKNRNFDKNSEIQIIRKGKLLLLGLSRNLNLM